MVGKEVDVRSQMNSDWYNNNFIVLDWSKFLDLVEQQSVCERLTAARTYVPARFYNHERSWEQEGESEGRSQMPEAGAEGGK